MALKLRATIILLFCAVALPMNAQNGGIHPNIRETLEQMESIAKPDTVKKVILDYAQYQITMRKSITLYHRCGNLRQSGYRSCRLALSGMPLPILVTFRLTPYGMLLFVLVKGL